MTFDRLLEDLDLLHLVLFHDFSPSGTLLIKRRVRLSMKTRVGSLFGWILEFVYLVNGTSSNNMPVLLTFLHFSRHVWNHQRNNVFESDQQMLDSNCKDKNVVSSPEITTISCHQELSHLRLQLDGNVI